jgi:hypothetical protein
MVVLFRGGGILENRIIESIGADNAAHILAFLHKPPFQDLLRSLHLCNSDETTEMYLLTRMNDVSQTGSGGERSIPKRSMTSRGNRPIPEVACGTGQVAN